MKKGVHAMLQHIPLYLLVSVLLAPAASQAQVSQVKYLSYDGYGNPIEVQDASGTITKYYYGSNTSPFSQSGMNGANGVYLTGIQKVQGSSDCNNCGTRPAGGDDLFTEAEYNALGQLVKVIDENEQETTYSYDELGRLEEVRNDAGQLVEDYRYVVAFTGSGYSQANSNHIRTRRYDGGQTRTSYEFFDGLGRLIQSQAAEADSTVVMAVDYDARGLEHKGWKPYRKNGGISFQSSYNAAAVTYYGNSFPFTEALYESSPLGRVEESIPMGGKSAYGSLTTAYGVETVNTTSYAVTETTDAEGKTVKTWTDGWGRTFRTASDPSGINAITEFSYDGLDRVTRVRHPNYFDPPSGSVASDWVTTYTYDSRGNLTEETSADFGTRRYAYDAAGNLRFSRDANQEASGETAFTSYDELGRMARMGVAPYAGSFDNLEGGSPESFESDEANWQLVNAWDGKPSTSVFPWDQFDTSLIINATTQHVTGRLAAQAYRFGGSDIPSSLTLDASLVTGDQTVSAADSIIAGNTIVENGADLTLKAGQYIRLKDGFRAEAGSRVRITADGALLGTSGQGVTDVAGSNPWQLRLFSYDDEGRLAAQYIYTGDKRDWDATIVYEYNRLGELNWRKVEFGGQTLYHHYEYNRLGQLVSVTLTTDGTADSEPEEITYSYTSTGAVDKIEYRGGTIVTQKYDIQDRLTDINDMGSTSGSPFAARYDYKKNSRINWARFWNPNIQTGLNLTTAHRSYTYEYSYDNLDRLTGADYKLDSSNPNAFDLAGITYDANGNIQAMRRRGPSGALIDDMSYVYDDANNQLTSINDVAGQVYGWDGASGSFTYDGNGNLTAMTGNPSISSITYDHRNLAVHTSLDGGVEQVANYNGEGQRILKEIQTPSGTTWDFYLRDGLSTLAVISNGELQFMNLYGNGVFGRVVANSGSISAGGAKRYYIGDLLGSVRAVVDQTGAVKENRDYGPWGVAMEQRQYLSGDKALEEFSGKELDDQTGWYHFGQRDLMAIYGRWPSPDRFADKYPSLSPYSYAANDPIGYIDVNGDSIDVSHLSAYVQLWVTSHLYQITGVQLETNENGMLVQVEDSEVTMKGTSKTARKDLMYALGYEDIIRVEARDYKSSKSSACCLRGKIMYLNLDQIMYREQNSEGVSSLTMGIGMSFMHELNHSRLGFNRKHTPHEDDPSVYSDPVLIRQNLYRREMGSHMGQQITYGHSYDPIKDYPYIPFSVDHKRRVYSNWSSGPYPYSQKLKRWR